MRFRLFFLLSAAFGCLLHAMPGQTPPRPVIHGGAPSVSPDGSRIAFLSDRDGSIDLYVISTDGTGETRLTQTPDVKGHPDWSSDGKEIRFAVFANDTSRIGRIGVSRWEGLEGLGKDWGQSCIRVLRSGPPGPVFFSKVSPAAAAVTPFLSRSRT